MSRAIPSHRVEIQEEDSDSSRAGLRGGDKTSHSRHHRYSDTSPDRGHEHPHPYPHPYYSPPPHMHYQPYYGPPVMYQPAHQVSHPPGQWVPVQHQNDTSPSSQTASPPHYYAINVHSANNLAQAQKQEQTSENKQLTIKEKVLTNVNKGLGGVLDMKVLATCATLLVAQFLRKHHQHNQQLRAKQQNRLGFNLDFALGSRK